MKGIRHLFIAIAITALFMFPGSSNSAESSLTGNTRASVESVMPIDGERSYVRVQVLDKWFIFVYEGNELLDIVPE
ncbi:MAG: hypothetical protein IPG99_09185 [Ignavibacteria bacterium]|nr:hypothetical protein [Ignavibacteria bacterium]